MLKIHVVRIWLHLSEWWVLASRVLNILVGLRRMRRQFSSMGRTDESKLLYSRYEGCTVHLGAVIRFLSWSGS
jgi:hypothetical protein